MNMDFEFSDPKGKEGATLDWITESHPKTEPWLLPTSLLIHHSTLDFQRWKLSGIHTNFQQFCFGTYSVLFMLAWIFVYIPSTFLFINLIYYYI
jgi:hypothetical protein